jgi:hypothetical protein
MVAQLHSNPSVEGFWLETCDDVLLEPEVGLHKESDSIGEF